MSTHPSFLALDRAALGVGDADIGPHLRACAACQAHVTALRAQPAMPAELQVEQEQRMWPRGLSLGFAALATLALIYVVAPTEPAPPVTAKGITSVVVFIKRNDMVFMWDTKPLHLGDRIQLVIEPGAMRQVYVLGADAKVLFSGPLAPGVNTLPMSWRVEGSGASEELDVVMSRAPLSADALKGQTQDLVRQHIVLPKEPAQ